MFAIFLVISYHTWMNRIESKCFNFSPQLVWSNILQPTVCLCWLKFGSLLWLHTQHTDFNPSSIPPTLSPGDFDHIWEA